MAVKPAINSGIYLVRHLKPLIPTGICYGQSDVPAEPLPPATARHLLRQLPPRASLFSSPLKRCSALATSLFPNQSIKFNPLLLELNFGAWEMCPWDTIPREQLDLWVGNQLNFAPPSGESFADLCSRVQRFLDEHLTCGSSHIIVTHGGIIKAFYYVLGVLDLPAAVGLGVDFGSVHYVANNCSGATN